MSDMQLTFTEKEVSQVAEFVNFVYSHASWSFKDTVTANKLHHHLVNLSNHIKKCEDHIFEVKAIYNGN